MSVAQGFMHFAFFRQNEDFQKRPINMVNFLYEKWGLFYACVSKLVCHWMLVYLWMCYGSRVNIYVCLRIYWHVSLHIYIYFNSLLLERGKTKEERGRREQVVEEGERNISWQSEWFFSLILPKFLIAKSLFDVNMKCMFCVEFCWVMMMFKIKINITKLLYIYNDCVVKGNVV